MHLQDILRICLHGLSSRFPNHVIDINESMLDIPKIDPEGWTVPQLIDFLENIAPDMLEKMAHMHIESYETAIYLPELSQEKPVFIIHCLGKLPPSHAVHTILKDGLSILDSVYIGKRSGSPGGCGQCTSGQATPSTSSFRGSVTLPGSAHPRQGKQAHMLCQTGMGYRCDGTCSYVLQAAAARAAVTLGACSYAH